MLIKCCGRAMCWLLVWKPLPAVAHRGSFSPMADSSESTRGVQRREGMQAGLVGNVEENEDEDEDEDENSMKLDEPDQREMPSTRGGSTMEERLRQCRPTVAGTLP